MITGTLADLWLAFVPFPSLMILRYGNKKNLIFFENENFYVTNVQYRLDIATNK